jgi:NAD(P)-dependent dehydrogenase (short-subunit alcohol dehydrogenase family)
VSSDAAGAVMVGKVVVVTGGSQGLGEATARLLRERGAAGLALVARDRERGEAVAAELTGEGCRAVFVAAELGDADACASVIAQIDEAFGVVHGLLNAAAITDRGGVWDTSVDLWDRMFDVNVRAPFLLAQGAARIMVREGVPGSIVNIGSMSGHGGQPILLPYAVSKGALHTLTKNLAYSLMRNRIRVNLLNLGWMDTPAEDDIQKRYHNASDDWLEKAEKVQPMGRLIKPAEVARVICFLLSEESGLMTGATVDFDQSILGAGDLPKPAAELLHRNEA